MGIGEMLCVLKILKLSFLLYCGCVVVRFILEKWNVVVVIYENFGLEFGEDL